jgi:hypothetical protein
MRIHSFVLAFFLLLLSFGLRAQKEETVLGERNLRFSGVWADWNHQITRFGSTNSYMSGWQFNLEFGKSVFLGFGNYYLQDDIYWDQLQNQDFNLRISAFKVGYGFQAYRALHPLINVDFGPGRVRLEDLASDRIFVVQPNAGLEINIFRWARLDILGGYRFTTDTNLPGLDDESLSGFFGQATLRFGFSWGRYGNRKNENERERQRD